jgi:hypothetical protein
MTPTDIKGFWSLGTSTTATTVVLPDA